MDGAKNPAIGVVLIEQEPAGKDPRPLDFAADSAHRDLRGAGMT